jgi:hypothetical protein
VDYCAVPGLKINPMEENRMHEFSWTSLFIVTGLCFFAFSWLLKILDDAVPRLFLWAGFMALGLGCLRMIAKLATRQKPVKAEEN